MQKLHTHTLSLCPRHCRRFTLAVGLTALVAAFVPIERAATPEPSEPPGSDSESQLVSVRAGPELERGPHHQVLQTFAEYSDATGQLITHTNAITVLATGLSYFEDGQWRETVEKIELFEQGAVARQGPHRVLWPLDVSSDEGVDVLTADGQRFRCHVLGLGYYDAARGASVLIAELKASQAELPAPNRLVYPDAFDGVEADLAYEYRRASVAQEVVLRGPLPDPAQLGLSPTTTRFEVLTEFLEAPVPVIERLVVRAETDPAQRALMHEPDLTDDQLQFAGYAMGSGRAFALESDASADQAPVPVVKRWEVIDGRTILLEQVEWPALAALLAQWPGQASAPSGEESVRRVASFERQSPLRPAVARGVPYESDLVPAELVAAQRLGFPAPGTGVVIDWVLVQSQTNFTFKADTTYLVMGSVNLTGSTTIEGGTVVKYTNAVASPKVSITGTILCQTGPYRPAVFTAKDDNTVGEIIPTSTGNPIGYYGNPAIEVRRIDQVLEGIRVRFAQTGVFYHDFSAGTGSGLLHAQLVRCGAAVQFNGYGTTFQNFTLRNVLVHQCPTAVYGYSFAGKIEHLTAHDCTQLAYDYNGQGYGTTSSLSVTNSVLAQIGSLYSGRPVTVSGGYNGLWVSPVFGSPYCTNDGNPFVTAGAGAHYLFADSTLHNLGTANINQGLLNALKTRTTHAPEELFTNFTADTTLPVSDQVTRDTDAPDLGWHYEALDYLWSNLNLTNATLTLSNRVAVAVGGPRGLRLQDGARVLSEGGPLALNWLVRYDTVQEQPLVVGGGGSSTCLFELNGLPAVLPEVRLKFTGVSFLAGPYSKRLLLENNTYWSLATFELSDSRVYGGALNLSLYPVGDARLMTVGLTNSLFARVRFSLDQDTDVPRLVVHARNNLFLRGWVRFADYAETGTWTVRDNLFDAVSLSGEDLLNSHNGYHSTPLLPGSTDHRILTAVDYLPGPLGTNYYPNTGGNLSELIDHGSRTASEAGLYLKTVLASQVPEGTSQVDIGFHYAPLITPEVVTTNLAGAVDVDYHPATSNVTECLIVSVNYLDGAPFNLARVDGNGTVTQWSSIGYALRENPLTTAKADGYGFTAGQTFFATGTGEDPRLVRVWRISPDGQVQQDWTTVNDDDWPGGLHIDGTGVFGHDLILVTGWLENCISGSVWRINGQGLPTLITNLDTCLEGALVCPTNQVLYGPWAGKLLTGAGAEWLVYYIAPDGTTNTTDLGLSPHDFHVIPASQDLYVVQWVSKASGPSRLLKVPRALFANLLGDILIVQSGEFIHPETLAPSNGELFVVHWTGTAFTTTRITDGKSPDLDPRQFEHAVFAPMSIPSNP